MKYLSKIIYIVAAVSLVACNSNKKLKVKNITKKGTQSFVVQNSNDDSQTLLVNFSKEKFKCSSDCKLTKTKRFFKLAKSNVESVYNYKGQLISQIKDSSSAIKLTDNFAKITSSSDVTVFSGYTGEKLLEEKVGTVEVKVSNAFLVTVAKKVTIWNSYGKVMDQTQETEGKVNAYISNGFVGYTLGHQKLVLFAGNNHKLANYTYKQKRPMRIQLNDSFAYYSIGKNIGALHAKNGTQLMNFAGRKTQAVYMNKNVGGFYDISESASFWRSNGKHIISLTKKPGLEVTQVNNQIQYRTKKGEKFKLIN